MRPSRQLPWAEIPGEELANFANCLAFHFEIVVAGISETRGPLVYMMRVTHNGETLDWVFDELDGEDDMWVPSTPEIEAELERHIETTQSDRLASLEWLIERARHIKSPVFGREADRWQVGGHAILTKISTGKIESSRSNG